MKDPRTLNLVLGISRELWNANIIQKRKAPQRKPFSARTPAQCGPGENSGQSYQKM